MVEKVCLTRSCDLTRSLFPAFYQPDVANQYTNHILFGNVPQANYINPYADMVKGYKEYSKTVVIAQAEIKQKLDFLTEGLNFRMMANTQRDSYFDLSRAYTPYYYIINRYDRMNKTYILENTNENSATEWLAYSPGTKTIQSSFIWKPAAQYEPYIQ